jgi:hypothetical protein
MDIPPELTEFYSSETPAARLAEARRKMDRLSQQLSAHHLPLVSDYMGWRCDHARLKMDIEKQAELVRKLEKEVFG